MNAKQNYEHARAFSLTTVWLHDRIKRQMKNAGMVELVDSVDLGSTARACRFESCCPHQQMDVPTGRPFAGKGWQDSNRSQMQGSGGALLLPVQSLVATFSFISQK